MLHSFLFCLVIVAASAEQKKYIWSVCIANNSCTCGSDVQDTVICHESSILIRSCYCMYYDAAINMTILGHCLSSCFYGNKSAHGRGFYKVERNTVQNASSFNKHICSFNFYNQQTNREGRFCGKCIEDYGLAAYSYHYASCVSCKQYGYKNWLKYFTIAFLPLTLFYFLVVFLKINVTSSYLNGLVFIIQCLLSPLQLRIYDSWTFAQNAGTSSSLHLSIRILTSILGILNLDFLRSIYPHFCLHPHLNFIHITALDYIIALYPFALILLTYLLITMYDKQYRIIVLAWRPFKWFLWRYRKHFSTQVSLIETFATFILLSNVKILGVCFDLLAPTSSFDATGGRMNQRLFYYDANVEYFSSKHLPFATLALFTGVVFVLLPFFLLLLYPCSCFQRILNLFKLKCHALHIFMDAFQGSYRTQPRDLRQFSAYYILLRILLLISVEYTTSTFYITLSAYVMIIGSFIFAIFQPYKNSLHNKIDISLMLLAALFHVSYSADIIGSLYDIHVLPIAQLLFSLSVLLLILFIFTAFILKPIFNKCKEKCNRLNSFVLYGTDEFNRDALDSPADQLLSRSEQHANNLQQPQVS